ncbi:lipid IV(A) 3-deoxy-D-manno-octulosonic acid transferase [Eionea flava]
MCSHLFRVGYTLLFYCTVPVICLRLLWRSIRAAKYRQRWSERFGFCFPSSSPQLPVIWLHTVSVGETIAAYPLAVRLLSDYPGHALLITTTTPTGSAQVLKRYAEYLSSGRVYHQYMPYDLPDCLARFLRYWRPVSVLFMETEVWPNTLVACRSRNIPSLLINARLSEKSFQRYQRLGCFAKKMFSNFQSIIAQSDSDALRLRQLSTSLVSVAGNIKSDITVSEKLRKQAAMLKKQWSSDGEKTVLIAASTHPSEDEKILHVFKSLMAQHKHLRLVLVPRHPERFNHVATYCVEQSLSVARYSVQEKIAPTTQVVIGDTVGELMLFYGASDIAIVGGSFITHGGHNMLEPAAWGLPIISGASLYNFSTIAAQMEEKQALVIARDYKQLEQQLHHWLLDSSSRESSGRNASQYMKEATGALQITLEFIADVLEETSS